MLWWAPQFLRVGDGYAATLIVTGYPDEVGRWIAQCNKARRRMDTWGGL
jgi:hypothetical protein